MSMNAAEAAAYVDASIRDLIASLPEDSPARRSLENDADRIAAKNAEVCRIITAAQSRADRRRRRWFGAR